MRRGNQSPVRNAHSITFAGSSDITSADTIWVARDTRIRGGEDEVKFTRSVAFAGPRVCTTTGAVCVAPQTGS